MELTKAHWYAAGYLLAAAIMTALVIVLMLPKVRQCLKEQPEDLFTNGLFVMSTLIASYAAVTLYFISAYIVIRFIIGIE